MIVAFERGQVILVDVLVHFINPYTWISRCKTSCTLYTCAPKHFSVGTDEATFGLAVEGKQLFLLFCVTSLALFTACSVSVFWWESGINLVTGHHRSFDQFEENIIGHFHKTMIES